MPMKQLVRDLPFAMIGEHKAVNGQVWPKKDVKCPSNFQISDGSLLLLQRFDIFDDIVNPHMPEVLVCINLVKHWSPDRHLLRSVRNRTFSPFKYVAYTLSRELSGVLGQ